MDKKQEREEFIETMNNWGLLVNARIYFNNFIKAVSTNEGLEIELKKIYRIVDDIVLGKEKEQFGKCLKRGTQYYRARIIDPLDDDKLEKGICRTQDGKFEGYDDFNSREPILGMGGEGRNNIAGASYLYVASNQETACTEIKSQFGDLISLATFEVIRPLYVIDFAVNKNFQRKDTEFHGMSMGEFFAQLMFRYCEPVRGDNAYRATQLISDYLRKTGIDGIRYKSFLSPGGFNFTIFNSHPDNIKFCGSNVLLHKQAKDSFWDFNNDTEVISNRDGESLIYNKKVADEHKKHLSQRFRLKTD